MKAILHKIQTRYPEEVKLFIFFGKLILIWLSWKILFLTLGEESVPINERFFPSISIHWEAFNLFLVHFILESSAALLNLIGYQAYTANRIIWIDGVNGFAMGNYCIGLQLIYYYSLLLVVSPMPNSKKIMAIPSGIVITFALNIIRSSSLCLVILYAPEYINIAHDHVFNVIVFGSLLAFYYWLGMKKKVETDLVTK